MLAFGKGEVDAGNFRLKIVHVETGRNFYGGAQQVIWLIQGLVGQGCESVLVCPAGARIAGIAREAGIDVINIPCAGEHDFTFPFRLHGYLVRVKPDIVHCHGRRGADFPGGWGAKTAGVPAVVSRRVDNPESPASAWLRYRPFSKVIAVSQNVASALARSRVSNSRVAVIRDAVDINAVNPDADRSRLRRFGVNDDSFAIAVVAQLIKRKGHRFLLDVLPALVAEHPHIKVVFFGVGGRESELRLLVARLGITDVVHFAGFCSDLDDYLGAFDLLVHPAEKEGLGVAMLKAAAVKLPVIAFDIAGSREAVQHLKTGILVPHTDLRELQLAIGTLCEEADIRAELGANGRERMQLEFNVETMAECHARVYEEIASG